MDKQICTSEWFLWNKYHSKAGSSSSLNELKKRLNERRKISEAKAKNTEIGAIINSY
jgi:hypothetical protein